MEKSFGKTLLGAIPENLGAVDTLLSDGFRHVLTTPNDMCMLLRCQSDTDVLLMLGMGANAGPSNISGEPGIRYKTDQVDMVLTPEELFRLVARNLYEEEFFALNDEFGMFFEIHDDFYDEETGEAVQPATDRWVSKGDARCRI